MIEKDNRIYARVSEILDPLFEYRHIDPQILSRKAAIGSAVHEAIAYAIQDEFPILEGSTAGYFSSFVEWTKRLNPMFKASEQRYFCDKARLTGQIDALCMIPGSDLPVLVDFKTSAQESKKVWPLQAHLYDYLLERNGIKVARHFLFVRLHKEGKLPAVHNYAFSPTVRQYCLEAIDEFWKEKEKAREKSGSVS
jgi:hypothetical protein